jgi:hypothetical protein
MTQLATTRSQPRPGPRRGAPPRRLRVVAPPAAEGNGLFLGLCVALLLGGFVTVLVLNTAMAKGSYVMKELQRRSDALTDSQDDLRHTLDAVSGPGPLARQARALGMVPAKTPVFLRLSDGEVLGVAKAATADEEFSVVTETEALPRRVPATTTATKTPAPSSPTGEPSPTASPSPSAPPSPSGKAPLR